MSLKVSELRTVFFNWLWLWERIIYFFIFPTEERSYKFDQGFDDHARRRDVCTPTFLCSIDCFRNSSLCPCFGDKSHWKPSLSTSFVHVTPCSVSYICWYVFLSAHSWCIYVAHCIVYKVLSSFFFSFRFLFFLFLISSYWITLCSSVLCPPRLLSYMRAEDFCVRINKWK